MIGASQSALSIQKPSQTGPRTQGEGKGVERPAAARSAPPTKVGLLIARLVSEPSSISGIEPNIAQENHPVTAHCRSVNRDPRFTIHDPRFPSCLSRAWKRASPQRSRSASLRIKATFSPLRRWCLSPSRDDPSRIENSLSLKLIPGTCLSHQKAQRASGAFAECPLVVSFLTAFSESDETTERRLELHSNNRRNPSHRPGK